MRIQKGVTTDFENYEVVCTAPNPTWCIMCALGPLLGLKRVTHWPKRRVVLKNIIEADDSTGLITRQIENELGQPLFTNGDEDIALSNECKLLLLMPPIQQAFLSAGFIPKTISTYEKDVRIVNKNPTVSIAVNVEQAMEAEG